MDWHFPLFHDNRRIFHYLGIKGEPATVIIDHDLKVSMIYDKNLSEEQYLEITGSEIEKLLKNSL